MESSWRRYVVWKAGRKKVVEKEAIWLHNEWREIERKVASPGNVRVMWRTEENKKEEVTLAKKWWG